MKIKHHCPYCLDDKFEKSGSNTIGIHLDHHQLTDNGVNKLKCEYGHEFAVVYNGAKFEILFDVGMSAIRDGYAREAVSSFSASLERFYEFYIRLICQKDKIEDEAIKSSWKSVSNQSERQLGAFIFLYTYINKKSPEILSSNDSGFRNKVIHKGYIPKLEEALDFGKSVYNKIMAVVKELEKNLPDDLSAFYESQRPNSQGILWTIHVSTKAIGLSRKSNGTCDLGFEHVKKLFFR